MRKKKNQVLVLLKEKGECQFKETDRENGYL